MGLSVYSVCMYACYFCAWSPWRREEGIRFLGTGVKDGCETPFELNLGPLQEQ